MFAIYTLSTLLAAQGFNTGNLVRYATDDQVDTTGLGVVAWFRADQIEGLSDGATLTIWEDKSKNGRDNTTVTGTPNIEAFSQNSHRSVYFATSEWVRGASFTSLAQPNTFIAVVKWSGSGSGNQCFFDGNVHQLLKTASNTYGMAAGTNMPGSQSADSDIHVVTCEFNTTSSNLWIDTTLDVANGNPGTSGMTQISIGARNTGAASLDGYIYELIVVRGTLSQALRERVRDDLFRLYRMDYIKR